MDEIEIKAGKLELALSKIYDMALTGMLSNESAEKIADDFTSRCKSSEEAIDTFVNWQIAKCTATGFLTGIGGLITLPVAIPIDLMSSLYIHLRMIAVIAKIRGYDIHSEQVRTFAFLALCGNSILGIVNQFGIQFGVKYFGRAIMKKVTKSVLSKITKAVGFKLVAKGGSKGIFRLSKAIPLIGGVIGGGLNLVETKIIASAAKKIFINN